ATLCRAAGLASATLGDFTARVPAEAVIELFDEAERRTGDALIGLHAGEHAEPRGPLAYLVMSHPSLQEGLRPVERFGHLAIDSLRFRVKRATHTASVVIDPGPELETSPHLTDYLLMASVRVLWRAIGPDFPLREVHVRHAHWRDGAEAAQAFGCPV